MDAGRRGRFDADRFAELLKLSLMRGLPGVGGRLTQRALAECLGMNDQTISRWARGETQPSDEAVERLRRLFGWSNETYESLYGIPPRAVPAEDWFESWREAVGFAAGFPRMHELRRPAPVRDRLGGVEPTEDSPKLFLDPVHRERAIEIYEALGSATLAITTAPGHGATTLARYLHAKAEEDAIIRRTISVHVSLEDLLAPSYEELLDREEAFLTRVHPRLHEGRPNPDAAWVQDEADEAAKEVFGPLTSRSVRSAIDDALHAAVVRSLVTRPWERVLDPALYGKLLDVDASDPAIFERRRAELGSLLRDGSEQQRALLGRVTPLLAQDWTEIAGELNHEHDVGVSLLLDLSATPMGRQWIDREGGEHLTLPYRRAITLAANALKGIERQSSDGSWAARFDTTYVLSESAWDQFHVDLHEHDIQAIRFPAYRPLDVFAMLAHHYPPYQGRDGGRTEVLAAVIDSEYVDIDERTAISTEMVLVDRRLRADIAGASTLTYHRRRHADRSSTPAEGR